MAACTLTTAVSEGRLPDRFWGLDLGMKNYDDFTNARFTQIAKQVRPGFYRLINWIRISGTAASPDLTHSGFGYRRQFWLDRYNETLSGGLPTSITPGVFFGATTGPPGKPRSLEPTGAQLVESSGQGQSPSDVVALVGWFLARVADPSYLHGVEFYNEPGTEGGANYSGAGTPAWFTTASPANSCFNWDMWQQRYFYGPVKAAYPNAKVCTWASANVSSVNGDNAIKSGLIGSGQSGWPHADSQLPYYDAASVHGYTDLGGGGRTVQNQNNTIYFTGWPQGSYGSALGGGIPRMRLLMNQAGGQSKRIFVSEFQIEPGPGGTNAVDFMNTQVATTILVANLAVANKVDGVISMSCGTDDTAATAFSQFAIRTGSAPNYTYTLQLGFFMYKQLASFFRTYLNSVVPNWTSRTELTPDSVYVGVALNNRVPRAQMYAGKNDAGTMLGCLCHNADTTASVTLSITLDVTPAGSATVTRWTTTTAIPSTTNEALDFPTSSLAAGGSPARTFSLTLAPNEVVRLDIPLTVSPTNSAPVNTSPPTLSVTSGSLALGGVLTANPGGWTGSPTPTFTYLWEFAFDRRWFTVAGSGSGNTLTIPEQVIGARVRVSAIGHNSVGDSLPVPSAATAVIPLSTVSGNLLGAPDAENAALGTNGWGKTSRSGGETITRDVVVFD